MLAGTFYPLAWTPKSRPSWISKLFYFLQIPRGSWKVSHDHAAYPTCLPMCSFCSLLLDSLYPKPHPFTNFHQLYLLSKHLMSLFSLPEQLRIMENDHSGLYTTFSSLLMPASSWSSLSAPISPFLNCLLDPHIQHSFHVDQFNAPSILAPNYHTHTNQSASKGEDSISVYVCVCVCVCVLISQLCLTLCDPMDCSPPGSSVHGILQARILEWVAIPFSRGSSRPRDQTWVSCPAGRFFTTGATKEALAFLVFVC